jgi:3,4-dehydroadipyl-CoA semialdehyde dehydrogenase
VVEAQRAGATQLLAAPGAARAAVQRLRHHIAMAGVQRRHVGRDHVHAAVAVGQLLGCAGGGEELGGARALGFYHRRSAVQASTSVLAGLAQPTN